MMKMLKRVFVVLGISGLCFSYQFSALAATNCSSNVNPGKYCKTNGQVKNCPKGCYCLGNTSQHASEIDVDSKCLNRNVTESELTKMNAAGIYFCPWQRQGETTKVTLEANCGSPTDCTSAASAGHYCVKAGSKPQCPSGCFCEGSAKAVGTNDRYWRQVTSRCSDHNTYKRTEAPTVDTEAYLNERKIFYCPQSHPYSTKGAKKITDCYNSAGIYYTGGKTITCPAGQYFKYSTTSCTECIKDGAHACPGDTFDVTKHYDQGLQMCSRAEKPNENYSACVRITSSIQDPFGSIGDVSSERPSVNPDTLCLEGQKYCEKGTYLLSIGFDESMCNECEAGYYCPYSKCHSINPAGLRGREDCPAGTYSNTTRAIAATACITCPNGTYSGVHATECTPCQNGVVDSGHTSCTPCGDNATVNADYTECVPNTYHINYHKVTEVNATWATGQNHPTEYTAGTGASIGKPSRSGYTFKGWCVGSDGCSSPVGVNGYTISTTTTGDIELYAQWQSNAPTTYTITYKCGNGASGTPTPPHESGISADANVTISPNANGCTKSGYGFTGEWKSSDHSLPTFIAGNSYSWTYGNVTLSAQWAKQYKILYKDGGVNAQNMPSQNTVIVTGGMSFNIAGAPTANGYEFKGWKCPNLSSDFIVPPASLVYHLHDHETCTAQWAKVYKITYKKGDVAAATGIPNTPASVTFNTSYVMLDTPISSGYTFTGWKCENLNNGLPLAANAHIVYNYAGDDTCVAQWQSNVTTNTITYYCGSGMTSGSVTPNNQTVVQGGPVTIKDNTCVKAGYSFDKWKFSNGNNTFEAGQHVTNWTYGNRTLVAQWNSSNGGGTTYNVTYSCGEGSGTAPEDSANYSLNATVATLANTCTAPSNKTFNVWDCGGTEVSAGGTFTITANTTCTAKWNSSNGGGTTYNVTYSCGEGSGTAPEDSANYSSGATVATLANTCTAPSNKTFNGWNCGGTEVSAGGTFTITANTTCTAKWNSSNGGGTTYNVTYSCGEGSGTAPEDSANYSLNATVATLANTCTAPSNKTFNVWDCGGTEVSAGGTFTITANTTCTAKWNSSNGGGTTYNVTYSCGEGSGTAPEDSTNYSSGATVTTLSGASCTAPSNNTFNGWNCGGTPVSAGGTFTITANTTCTAQWQSSAPGTYTITYHNVDDATWATDQNHPTGYTFGTGASIGKPSRNGYTFTGWCVGSDNCNNYADNANGYTISTTATGNVNLYAQWQIVNVTAQVIPDVPAGQYIPAGGTQPVACTDSTVGTNKFCPGGDLWTLQNADQGVYTCLDGAVANIQHTACTLRLTEYRLKYGFGNKNCWKVTNQNQYQNCVYYGARKITQ
jgi:uncharacterized repeat protein (TIGR02543 family)